MSISSMLAVIYGGGVSSTPALSSNPIVALSIAEKTESSAVENEAKEPSVSRDIVTFTAAVKAAKTPAQLLQNPTVLKVLLSVNGLSSQLPYTALAEKALLSDPGKANSLANQLSSTNESWLTAAQAYSFATKGLSVIQAPKTLTGIANAYAQQTWLTSLNQGTPGLANALNFRSLASSVTSVDQILGNSILRTVVTTALDIPEQIAFQPLEAQQQAIISKLDIRQFGNPTFVENFAQRYLLAAGAAAASGTSTSPTLDALAEHASLVT